MKPNPLLCLTGVLSNKALKSLCSDFYYFYHPLSAKHGTWVYAKDWVLFGVFLLLRWGWALCISQWNYFTTTSVRLQIIECYLRKFVFFFTHFLIKWRICPEQWWQLQTVILPPYEQNILRLIQHACLENQTVKEKRCMQCNVAVNYAAP